MKVLILLLCLCLSGCAYGMYDQGSGLFWVDQPISQKIEAQNAVMWNRYYQQQQLFQQMNLNNTLQGMRYGY